VAAVISAWTLIIADIITAIAVAIVGLASVEAAIAAGIAFVKTRREHQGLQHIRWRYGRWLTLALDFLIAGDILRTAVEPGWTEIGQLAAIIVLRTVITFTLSKEIKEGPGTT
jgi:uncharacterized membrane protein